MPRRIFAASFYCLLAASGKAEESSNTTNCTLCPDGSRIDPSLSTKELPFLEPYFDRVPTCAEWETSVSVNLNTTSPLCADTQVVSPMCGCEAPQGSCNICPEGQTIPDPNKMVPFVEAWYGFIPTCELWDAMVNRFQDGSIECTGQRVFSEYCGCTYFDFNSNLWTLLSRTSGTISLVASLSLLIYLIVDAKRRSSTYHQIVMGISSCDIMSSIWFILADIPAPDYVMTDRGLATINTKFCTAQGFFLQLGFAAMFYNVSLTLFYMLTIAEGWGKSKIERARLYLLVLPFGIGLIFACAGIPFYDSTGGVCHLQSLFMAQIFGASEWAIVFIAIIPICFCIALITAMQIRIFWFVRKSEQKMLKWRFSRRKLNEESSGGHTLSMTEREQQVFWQSVSYVGSFYITWPVVLTSFLLRPGLYEDPASAAYNITNATYFLWPLQGFFTCFVYFRPRLIKAISRCIDSCRAKASAHEQQRTCTPTANVAGSDSA